MKTRASWPWHAGFCRHVAKDLALQPGIFQPRSAPLPHRRPPGQRAYDELRTAILHGELPAGRIEIQQMADRLGVSSTPVREALARMASEQLILFTPGQGYAIAHLSSKALCDLYVWTDRIVRLALDLSRDHSAGQASSLQLGMENYVPPATATDYAQDVSALFEEIAYASGNGECVSKVGESNARLFRARIVEWKALTDIREELSQLILLWRVDRCDELTAKVRDFHLRRIGRCEALSYALSRMGVAQGH
jgi:regulatory GntR family protein